MDDGPLRTRNITATARTAAHTAAMISTVFSGGFFLTAGGAAGLASGSCAGAASAGSVDPVCVVWFVIGSSMWFLLLYIVVYPQHITFCFISQDNKTFCLYSCGNTFRGGGTDV